MKKLTRMFGAKASDDARAKAVPSEAAVPAVLPSAEEPEEMQLVSLHLLFAVLTSKWRTFLAVLLAATVLSAAIFCFMDRQTASTVMSLNYEESSQGRNPNGTRFNISDLRTIAIADATLKAAGLDDRIDPEVLVAAISITPYSNRSFVSGENFYISSSFRITLRKPLFKSLDISAEDLMNFLCQSYKDSFYSDHIITAKVLEQDDFNYTTSDYSDIIAHFTLLANRIDRFLDMRVNEVGTFATEDGDTFKSLRKLISNLKTYDMGVFEAFIWENGLSKDTLRRRETLEYINHDLGWTFQQTMAENNAYVQTIEAYNQAMTSSILVPTYDNVGEFYMSRTKTGIDDIAKTADSKLSSANAVRLSILMNSDKLQKLNPDTTPQQLAYADTMVERIVEQLDAITERVIVADNAFTMQKTRNYIAFEPSHSSLIGQFHLKRVILLDVVLFAALYIFFAMQRRHQRRQARLATGKDGDVQ